VPTLRAAAAEDFEIQGKYPLLAAKQPQAAGGNGVISATCEANSLLVEQRNFSAEQPNKFR